MTYLKINPGKLKGNVKIPPSKSMAHRAVICAALSDGISKISNVEFSDDIIATINAMRALGAVINETEDEHLEVRGINYNNVIPTRDFKRVVDCNESGSTLRFLIPISLAFEGVTRFIGRGNLGKRPLDTFYNIFDKQGIDYTFKEGELDLIVSGLLKADTFEVRGDISSQFITGLLFTLPLLDGDSKIVITTELQSKGYLDLTLSAMKDFGVEVINNNYKEFIIKGNQKYKAREYRVEGDYSQGAFFLVADALGSQVEILDLKEDSLQGDRAVIDVLSKMGVNIETNEGLVSGKADKRLNSLVIDGSQFPDIIPILALAASLAEGRTEIVNAERLRIKECDRLNAVTLELNKLGAKITEKQDGLIIEGVEKLKGGVEVWSHKDHRIAMTLAIASTMCDEPIILKDYECVSKSYPNFFDDFKLVGGTFDEWSLGK
ncbi:MAG: 3-phosphoshikimate 1-carboxyvinyltransferase [Clostridium sp.]|uniref:3-phosphoshikimate 1-carboxyvinyltransferase n=1 Tax=Clostridium sp. DSM 8431 TaxID=1761781 RepID=UPI0008F168CF|nr:3-phosphoshikimate 1-carboxyvinyltransferase [Clostridium sp. DSM 8431]MCR4945263.1 3-phosphoshikimate 1-carboxyvinyltransferase [Clostridium sp.]SFU67498.1 3-phosphoshikimate 1-carboxyvinyltransferase [Clostridium sp. DSM 8431]